VPSQAAEATIQASHAVGYVHTGISVWLRFARGTRATTAVKAAASAAFRFDGSAFLPRQRVPPGRSSLAVYGRGAGVGRVRLTGVGLAVGEGLGVDVGVAVDVAVAVAVAVGVDVGVGVGVDVGVGVGLDVGVGVGVPPAGA
jgi:hypothetical protein